MLQTQKTMEKFGYNPELLSEGSHKTIILICDYCQKEYTKEWKGRSKANKIVNKDCCISCKFKKREEVSLKRDGVKNSAQRPDIRKKISDASSDRLKSEEFKEQAKQTMISKYGVEHAMYSDVLRNKQKQTMLDKYGVEYVYQVPEFQEKARQTCLEKYGNIFPTKTEKGKQEILEGVRKKYGCDNVFQNKDIKKKSRETCLRKYGLAYYLQDKERAKLNTQKGVQTRIKKGQIRLYNGKTIIEWAREIGFSRSRFSVLVNQYGFETAVKMEPHISTLETLVTDWLTSISIEHQSHYKVETKIADIYIPLNKVIIETDGLYWHSDAIVEDKDYHVNKRKLYIDNGYIPLFFREYELINKDRFEVVKSIIKNKLGQSTQIYARKCEIISLTKDVAKEFFVKNHLMGNGAGNTYALSHEGNIVSAIQVKDIKNGCEISRFCHTLNTGVVGGFSRLVKHIRSNKPLTTFIDLRYGSGNYLTALGFVYQHTYPSFKWTDGTNVFNRMRFPSMSGYEQGLFRLWDCGQAKYILPPP